MQSFSALMLDASRDGDDSPRRISERSSDVRARLIRSFNLLNFRWRTPILNMTLFFGFIEKSY